MDGLICLDVFSYSQRPSPAGWEPPLSCVSVTAQLRWLTLTHWIYIHWRTHTQTHTSISYHLHPELPNLFIQTLPPSVLTGVLRGGHFGFSPERGRIFSHPPEQTLGSLPADFCLYVFQIWDGVVGSAFIHRTGACKEKIFPKDYVLLVCLALSFPLGLDDILYDSRWAVLDCAKRGKHFVTTQQRFIIPRRAII